jgi:Cft2 family RNA processing exonuclease
VRDLPDATILLCSSEAYPLCIVSLAYLLSFLVRHISHLPQTRGWERKIADGPPCVLLASPGMLQSGMSRELLELWAPDNRNGLIVTGYSVEGTLARVSLDPSALESMRVVHVYPSWKMRCCALHHELLAGPSPRYPENLYLMIRKY